MRTLSRHGAESIEAYLCINAVSGLETLFSRPGECGAVKRRVCIQVFIGLGQRVKGLDQSRTCHRPPEPSEPDLSDPCPPRPALSNSDPGHSIRYYGTATHSRPGPTSTGPPDPENSGNLDSRSRENLCTLIKGAVAS